MELFQFGIQIKFEVSNEVSLVRGVGGIVSGDVSSGGKVDLSSAPVYDGVGGTKPGEP